jgi:hypothetical protein
MVTFAIFILGLFGSNFGRFSSYLVVCLVFQANAGTEI